MDNIRSEGRISNLTRRANLFLQHMGKQDSISSWSIAPGQTSPMQSHKSMADRFWLLSLNVETRCDKVERDVGTLLQVASSRREGTIRGSSRIAIRLSDLSRIISRILVPPAGGIELDKQPGDRKESR